MCVEQLLPCLLGCPVVNEHGDAMQKKLTLQDILTPKQFRVALLVTSGLKNSESATVMNTTENMIKNILREVYDRSGCSNRVELALLLVHEAETGMYHKETFDEALVSLRRQARASLNSDSHSFPLVDEAA